MKVRKKHISLGDTKQNNKMSYEPTKEEIEKIKKLGFDEVVGKLENYTFGDTEIAKGCKTLTDVMRKNQYKEESFMYQPFLDIGEDEIWQKWGADKVYIKNVKEFCKVFDIDYEELKGRVKLTDELRTVGFSSNIYITGLLSSAEKDLKYAKFKYVFYSRDNKLELTTSMFSFDEEGKGAYVSYLGVTAELSRAIKTMLYFAENCEEDEDKCWGIRDFI